MSKGQRTRQHIIARAAPVFNTKGFFGTSMGDLTRETGLEKGGIYNHFPSKEALAIAAFDFAAEGIAQRMRDAIADQQRAVERLLAVITVFRDIIEDPTIAGGCPVLNTAIEADDAYPELRARAQEAMHDWLRLIGGTVKDGIRNGELRPDTDPRMVASVVVSTLEGAIMLSKLYSDGTHMERAVQHLQGYIRTLAQPDAR